MAQSLLSPALPWEGRRDEREVASARNTSGFIERSLSGEAVEDVDGNENRPLILSGATWLPLSNYLSPLPVV